MSRGAAASNLSTSSGKALQDRRGARATCVAAPQPDPSDPIGADHVTGRPSVVYLGVDPDPAAALVELRRRLQRRVDGEVEAEVVLAALDAGTELGAALAGVPVGYTDDPFAEVRTSLRAVIDAARRERPPLEAEIARLEHLLASEGC